MEIEIIGKPITEATLDLVQFKEILSKTWNLKKTINEVTTVHHSEVEPEQFNEFIYHMMDWGAVIKALRTHKDKTMIIKLVNVKYTHWTRYSTGTLQPKKFELNETVKDGTKIMIMQSLLPSCGFNVHNFIYSNQFRYDEEWMRVCELK